MLEMAERDELRQAIDVAINTNSLICASCLDVSMTVEDEASEMFHTMAELCATNTKLLRTTLKELDEAWGIIDFRRDIEAY